MEYNSKPIVIDDKNLKVTYLCVCFPFDRDSNNVAIDKIIATYVRNRNFECRGHSEFKNNCIKNNIPCYVHIDASLYGGIPKNQVNSPAINLNEITSMGIDSISISLHKYLGVPKTNGVLLAKSQINSKFIDCIGQSDVTLCGSRDFLPYTTLQKIKEQYERNNGDDYSNNVIFFENLLNENNIFYEKGLETGNIFILDKPSDNFYEIFRANKKQS